MKISIKYILLVFGIALLILSFIFKNKSLNVIENGKNNTNEFNKRINSEKSYLYVDYFSNFNVDGFVVGYKDDKAFIVYVKDEELLKKYEFDGLTIKIVGNSTFITNDVKTKILQKRNEGIERVSEDYLKEQDFEKIYGRYYLEVEKVVNDRSLFSTLNLFYYLTFILGLTLIISFVSLFIYENKRKKHDYNF